MSGHPISDSLEIIGSGEELDEFVDAMSTPGKRKLLSDMRLHCQSVEDARIIAGGKRGDRGVPDKKDQFDGEIPGIWEEAIYSLKASPVIFLAAWGGAVREAAFHLEILEETELRVPYIDQDSFNQLSTARDALREAYAFWVMEFPNQRDICESFAARDDSPALSIEIARALTHMLQLPPAVMAQE